LEKHDATDTMKDARRSLLSTSWKGLAYGTGVMGACWLAEPTNTLPDEAGGFELAGLIRFGSLEVPAG